MAKVTSLEDHKPHLSIEDSKGNMHVVPVQLIVDIESGKKELHDDMKPVVMALAYDWLVRMGAID